MSPDLERRERRGPRAGSGPVFPGPLLMLFPLLLLAGGVAFLQSRRPARQAPPAPPRIEEPASVGGWAGSLGRGAGVLEVRLRPLHEEPARQAYDAESLARRLDLPDGEPWSLELTLSRGEGADVEAVGLDGLVLLDDAGEAAAPLTPHAAIGERAVADPLRVLLSPPRRLLPGERRRLVLWGRRPTSGAKLRCCGGSIELAPRRFELLDRSVATARLEREAPAGDGGEPAEGR